MKEKKKHIIIIITVIITILQTNTVYSQEKKCTDCHKEIIKKEVFHAAAEDCSNCHSISQNSEHFNTKNGFSLNEKMPDLCYMCHESKSEKNIVHVPSAEGECAVCHDPHGAPFSNLLKESPSSKLCFECHDSEIAENKYTHLPVKQGNCEKCHNPHQSETTGLLKKEKPELCFTCHEKQQKEAELNNIHPPFDDDCANCHNSHNSEYKNLLPAKTSDVCFNCHEGQDLIQNSKSVHGILKTDKSCTNCHSPHAGQKNKFLFAENNELCLSCHNKTIKTNNKTIENINLKIKNAKTIHPPVEIDGCGSCHKPHYSENPFLLNFKFPEKRYSEAIPENFALCFECHDSDLLTKQNTTSATNFRNGNKNMHYLHIKGKKGRNCNLCHDIHASKNPLLIKEKSKFGNWEMNMNFKVFDKGGSCFPGCHGEKKYLRN